MENSFTSDAVCHACLSTTCGVCSLHMTTAQIDKQDLRELKPVNFDTFPNIPIIIDYNFDHIKGIDIFDLGVI